MKRSETAPPRKRSKPRVSAAEAKLAFEEKYRDKLVVDDVPSHNALALCESAASAGPSFVNPEHGYFCDMQTKMIHPVCKEQNGTDVCFDMEQRDLGKFYLIACLGAAFQRRESHASGPLSTFLSGVYKS